MLLGLFKPSNFFQRFPDRSSHNPASSDRVTSITSGDKDAQLLYHKIGTHQGTPYLRIGPTELSLHAAEDLLVMENPDQPEWLWGVAVSEVDGRWLELSVSRDTSRVCLPTFPWMIY